MKQFIKLFICLCLTFSLNAQNKTSTYTKTINLDPQDGNGMLGTVTMVYAFSNCFGDTVMAYGYKNPKVTGVSYNGKSYSADQLGINNFENYVTSFNVDVNYYFGSNFVTTSSLRYILDSYDIGCYGQTDKISSKNQSHNSNLNNLSVNFENAALRINSSLAFKIDNYEKDKLRKQQYNLLMEEANGTSIPQNKLEILREARSYAKSDNEKQSVNNLISEVEQQIEQLRIEKEREEELERLRQETEAENKRLEKEKENAENAKRRKERKVSEEKLNESSKNLYDSENKLLNQAESMRDEANSMVVEYRFQQEYKEKMLRDAQEIENYVERSRRGRRFATVGSDETGRQAAAVNAYNERMSYANEVNSQIAAESAAATIGVLYLLGGVIYDDYGANDGSIYKEKATNFHLGLDIGFSSTSAPVFLPSEYTTIDNNTGEEFTEKLNMPGQPVTINLGAKTQLAVESNNYRVEVFGGLRAGISPILDATHFQYSYGAQVTAGIKNLKVLGGYEFRNRSFTLNGWLDEQEDGKGKSNIGTTNIKLGLEISWYGNEKAFGRNHISFGLMQDQINKLGTDNRVELLELGEVTVGDTTYDTNGQAGFYLNQAELDEFNELTDFYKFTGAFFEWRHDHHGTFLIEFFPKYPHTGIGQELFDPNDWDEAGGFLLTVSFTRNLDWFFN